MVREYEPSPHPPRSNWETFLQEEHYLEEGNAGLDHLEECEDCQETVLGIVREDAALIRHLKEGALRETPPRSELSPCISKDSLWEYADWLNHTPPPEKSSPLEIPAEFRPIETHLSECDRCVTSLVSMQLFLTRFSRKR